MRGRPRTPSNILRMRGSDKRQPGRFKEREFEPVCTRPLGDPPEHLDEKERSAWNELVDCAPAGVLTYADRLAVEEAARILIEIRDGTARSPERTLFKNYLGLFGMTPADRSKVKVSIPTPKPGNQFAAIG